MPSNRYKNEPIYNNGQLEIITRPDSGLFIRPNQQPSSRVGYSQHKNIKTTSRDSVLGKITTFFGFKKIRRTRRLRRGRSRTQRRGMSRSRTARRSRTQRRY